tara:strand:- start:170 stop:358 length:189 start_codon:yes stop_codon:yes gene_type:complete
MAKQNFDYDKVYTAGWKDAMEEMQEKLNEERKVSEQFQAMVLILLEKVKEKDNSLQNLINRV